METSGREMTRQPPSFDERDHMQYDRDAECYQGRSKEGGASAERNLNCVEESYGVQRNRGA